MYPGSPKTLLRDILIERASIIPQGTRIKYFLHHPSIFVSSDRASSPGDETGHIVYPGSPKTLLRDILIERAFIIPQGTRIKYFLHHPSIFSPSDRARSPDDETGHIVYPGPPTNSLKAHLY